MVGELLKRLTRLLSVAQRAVAQIYINSRQQTKSWAAGALFLLILPAMPSSAQTGISATFSGTVTDRQGAVVVDARVELDNADQGIKLTTKTDNSGSFSEVALRPGRYVLLVSHVGFDATVVRNITLSANDNVALQVMLKVAGRTESVTVNDRPSLINLSPAVSNTIDHELVAELPLDGRSIQSLITLSPGIQLTPVAQNGGNPGQFSVNGMRSNANYFTVDGVSANFGAASYGGFGGINDASSGSTPSTDVTGSFANLVSVDDLQEIQIQTSTYAPEFGRSPGGQISMVTRSGENNFHGALYEYFRNDALDATDWFSNYLQTGKTALRYNDFGGVFGGPILLPKYNGRKHHSFFFFSYEGSRFVLPQPAITSIVPSITARQNAPTEISKEILSAFPLPTDPAFYTDGSGNSCTPGTTNCNANGAFFAAGFSNPSRSNVWSLRLDQNLHDKYVFFARYNRATSGQVARNGTTNAAELNNNNTNTETLTLGTTQSFTPRFLNQFSINASSQSTLASATQDNFGGAVPLPNSLLFPSNPCVGCGGSITIYGFNAASTPAVINLTNPTFSKNRQINGVDNLSYRLHDHQLKFGADYRYLSPISAQQSVGIGAYFSNVQALDAGSNEIAIAAFNQSFAIALKSLSLYAQDTWKAAPRLTLTYGVRWELNPPPTGKNGKHPLTVQSLNLNTLDFTYLVLAPAGTPLYPTTYKNFAPRFGFAYTAHQTPGRETVLRAGAGMFYDTGQNGFGNISFPYSQSYFLPPGGAVPGYPALTLPVPTAYAQAPAPNFTPSPTNQASPTVAAPNYKLPVSYEWNVTIEQSLGPNTAFSLAYVGSTGHSLQSTEQYIFAPPGTPGVPVSANFSALSVIGNLGESAYHSLQTQVHSRFTKRFELLTSFTWSHGVDNGSNDAVQFIPSGIASPRLNRGDSDYDVRDSVSQALTYNIPSVNWHNPLSQILKNWALNNLLSAHSSLPFDVDSQIFSYVTNGGYYTLRADTVPGQPQWLYAKYLPGTHNLVPGGKYLNALAFTDPPVTAEQGDLRRNLLRGFNFWQLDFGVHRQFPITKSLGVQFRAEMFNILNHPNFASPGLSGTNYVGYTAPGTPFVFGESTASYGTGLGGGGNTGGFNPLFQQGGPRAIQMALRVEF
jgi:hypothetical protein